MGSKSCLVAPRLDLLLGDISVLHLPFFGSGKLEYYLARRRRAWRCVAPAPLRPSQTCAAATCGGSRSSCAPCCAGGAQGGQALLLQAPPAGRSEKPCRASGGLLVRPAAQQLLGKVGLLRAAAAATGTEQRPTWSCGTRTRWPICALCPARRRDLRLRRPSLHLPRPTTMARRGGGTTWPSTQSSETHSSRAACPSS